MKKTKTDKTTKERQAKRRSLLDRIARSLGFHSWSELETETIKGKTKISKC